MPNIKRKNYSEIIMTTKKRIRTKAKTYSEFMSWLEGVESMQDPNWSPTPEQWRTIREMIGKLKPEIIEKKVAPVAQFTAPPPQQTYAPIPQQTSQITHMPQSSTLESVPQRALPSGITTPNMRRDGVPNATSTKQNEVLDTSKGDYVSEFM